MADNLSDLPEEVAAVIRPHLEPDDTTLDAISNVIAARRDEAKAARAGSGAVSLKRSASFSVMAPPSCSASTMVTARR